MPRALEVASLRLVLNVVVANDVAWAAALATNWAPA